jgi:alpha-beta hydrolase superfamily lysophospholipase
MNIQHLQMEVGRLMATYWMTGLGLGIGLTGCAGYGAETTNLLADLPSKFANFDKVRVHHKSMGNDSNAVVFVHGFTADMNSWRFQAPAFAGKGRVIFLDLPGHGQSDKPKSIDYTMDYCAKAVNAVLEDAGVEKAALVGHSMGTSVAGNSIGYTRPKPWR